MEIVKLDRPQHSDAIAEMFDAWAAKAREGEFEMAVIVAVRPDGSWSMRLEGKPDNLRMVGILESAKTDVLAATKGADR